MAEETIVHTVGQGPVLQTADQRQTTRSFPKLGQVRVHTLILVCYDCTTFAPLFCITLNIMPERNTVQKLSTK